MEKIVLLSADGLEASVESQENGTIGPGDGSAPAGNSYYTPVMGGGFYTPWGNEPADIGLGYVKSVVGAVGLVCFLMFVLPYALDFVLGLIDEWKGGTR